MAARRVADVQIDVVRVGLPVQQEAGRRLDDEGELALGQGLLDASAVAAVREVRGPDHAGVAREHERGTGEAIRRGALIDAGEDRRERARVVAVAEERVREQAVARELIRAIGDRAAVGVDREAAGGRPEALRAARRRTGGGRRAWGTGR